MQLDQLLITETNMADIVICPKDFGMTDGVIDIMPLSMMDANCTIGFAPFTGSQTIVRPVSTAFISELLCQGESLTVNGTVYDQFNPSGTQTLQNAAGCDSLIEIQLAFYPEAIYDINQTLCYGGSLIINDTEYNESHPQGTEILQGESMNGCDSIIEIALAFDSMVMSSYYTTLCPGESIEINGNRYDEIHPGGTETFPGGSVLGCDSVVNVQLSFYPTSLSSLNPILCRGDMVIINGTVYDDNHSTGMEIIENGSVFGCDSVIQVALTFIPEAYTFITDTLDTGDSIIVNGTVYNQFHSQGMEIIVGGSVTGCDSTIEIALYFHKALTAFTEVKSPVCHGESTGEIVIKEIAGGAPPFVLSIDGGNQLTINILPVILSGLNSGQHQVIIQDANSNQLVIDVEVPDSPLLEVDAGMDLSIKEGESASLLATSSYQVTTWLWTPDDFLSCTDCPDPLIENPEHDVTYTIMVTDENGCEASDEVVLIIRYEDEIYVPTVFSPNGDGVNDTWRIYSADEEMRLISLSIMDRWGGILFQCSDRLLNDSGVEWDGSIKGREMGAGVYVFVAVVENGSEKITRLKGDITLVR